MKRNTPLITLLTGAALGVVLLIASMLSTPTKAPAGYIGARHASAGFHRVAQPSPASATSTPSTASPSPTATAVVTAPARADYAGRVQGNAASIAISIHDGQAIAYVCNGSVIESWYKGTATNGVLIMTGKNHAHLSAIYDFRKVTGDVLAHGTDYQLRGARRAQAIGPVPGHRGRPRRQVKAGWIVLSNGTKVGSLESNANSAAPSATQAPALDVATGTAQDGNTVLHAIRVSGVTGSGF